MSNSNVFEINPTEVPAIRIAQAIANKSSNNICFVVGGGLGDRICAEPTLRYAINTFPLVKFSLACETPELFNHLQFDKVYNFLNSSPREGQHLYLHTYPVSPLLNQFVNANLTHCVDFPSLATLRTQLAPKDKVPQLFTEPPSCGEFPLTEIKKNPSFVLVHCGKTWASRTLPSSFYNSLTAHLRAWKMIPVLIGQNCVDVDQNRTKENCVDLRNRLNLNDFMWLCQNANKIVTNDSSPLHIASTGKTAKIAFVPTCRRPDLITHHRAQGYGWNVASFVNKKGVKMWELFDSAPNTLDPTHITEVPRGYAIEDFMPNPLEIVWWLA